ncbi:Zn-ribbon domain-containing OB-fold protein [Limoniibacter endophyticus]
MFDTLADEKRFALQKCRECQTFLYPAREVCVNCLSSALDWTDTSASGSILARTLTRVSAEPYFLEHGPVETGLAKLDCGPIIVCFLAKGIEPGTKVHLSIRRDAAGRGVFFATATVP